MLAFLGLEWNDSLGISDILVGGGTLLLAGFTARLASVTTGLDERNAARARKRREREVRGVARLVSGELSTMNGSLKLAHEEQKWQWFYPLPHDAWDRDGALIAETLPEDEVTELINLYTKVLGLERLLGLARARVPVDSDAVDIDRSVSEVIAKLSALVAQCRRYLDRLAYPDGRDLEPDPDDELAWRRERRRKLWERLRHPRRSA